MTITKHQQIQPGRLTIPILLVVTDRDYYPLPEDLEWVAALNESPAETTTEEEAA